MSWFEAGIAAALFVGVLLGALQTRRLFLEADERERVITVARGAVAEVVAQRFAEWALSAAESDVALFALKGCTIAEISRMRGSAEGNNASATESSLRKGRRLQPSATGRDVLRRTD